MHVLPTYTDGRTHVVRSYRPSRQKTVPKPSSGTASCSTIPRAWEPGESVEMHWQTSWLMEWWHERSKTDRHRWVSEGTTVPYSMQSIFEGSPRSDAPRRPATQQWNNPPQLEKKTQEGITYGTMLINFFLSCRFFSRYLSGRFLTLCVCM